MRKRSTPHSFAENLSSHKRQLEDRLPDLSDRSERASVLQKIAQVENAIELNEMLKVGDTIK